MFPKFHGQWETWQGSAAKAEKWGGERKQRRACAAHSDSITAPLKDLVCLHRLSEAQPETERERERVTEQREEDETKHRAQRDETRHDGDDM